MTIKLSFLCPDALFFCSGSNLLLFSALVVANLSAPAVDYMLLMFRSLRFCKMQALSDFMKQPAFRSIQQSQVWSFASASPSNARHCHLSIPHRFTIRIAVPDPLKLREGVRPLLCHTPQLSQSGNGAHRMRRETVMFFLTLSLRHVIGHPFCTLELNSK